MNRRSFFRNLGIGLVAAPAIAKMVMRAEPVPVAPESEWCDCTDLSPVDINELMAAQTDHMREQILRHVATTDPYAGITMGLDQHPLRFSCTA